MEKCTRIGCGASYDPAENSAALCNFHPGAPLFHEGLKSYTCCKDTNKPVLSFDEFLKIPGCTSGSHSSEKTEVKAPVVTANVQDRMSQLELSNQGEAEVPVVASTSTLSAPSQAPQTFKSRPTSPAGAPDASTPSASAPAVLLEEQDPADAVIAEGTTCKRQACRKAFQKDSERTDSECTYHPLPAIFHEGSKGYACCKRRVLEFDEFLRIEGCKQGRHLFVGQPKVIAEGEEEKVECRSDMYQTPTQVIASIFGKQADKARSTVTFSEWELEVDLVLPQRKRFSRTYSLYGPIDAAASSYRVLGTKVELVLVKADGRSWPALEEVKSGLKKGPQITFGVQGRTGSVGAKEMIYNGDVVHG